MKNLSTLALVFFACSLLASTALCQSGAALDDLPGSVVEARCQYSTADEACASQAPAAQSTDSGKTVAQNPRRFPVMGARRPPRPMMAYPMPEPSLRHAAIGGLIGFAFGVSRPNSTPRDRLALGLIVGLIGSGIGAAIPSFHGRYSTPHGPWSDDEMGSSKPSKSAPGERRAEEPAEQMRLAQTADSKPTREPPVEVSRALTVSATP
jgi:hypothetical protein